MSVQWYVNLDTDGSPWLAYGEKDSVKIEKAFAKHAKSCMLNPTYKIDFTLMRQVRRDDEDRWRIVKRGGDPSDPLPKDDEDEEEEEEAAASTPAPAAAAPAKVTKKESVNKRATKKADAAPPPDEDVVSVAPSMSLASTAVLPAAAAATSSVDHSAERAALERQVASLKSQMSSLENELETALAGRKEDADAAQKSIASLREDVQRALDVGKRGIIDALAQAKKEQDRVVKELVAAAVAPHEKQEKALNQQLAQLTKEKASLSARISSLESEVARSRTLQEELEESHSLYATLIHAIKPVVAVFGIDVNTPIGKAIAAYEKLEKGGKISPTTAAAAAAAAAAPNKKRVRDQDASDADEEEEERPKPKVMKKARVAPSTPPPAPASPVTPPRPAPVPAPAAAPAAAAALDDDEDATQPMIAPEMREDAGAVADVDMVVEPSAVPPPARTFTFDPAQLKGVSLVLKDRTPLSFAHVPCRSTGARDHLIVVGSRDGALDLIVDQPTASISLVKPSKVGTAPSNPDDGEDYSLTSHVLTVSVLPLPARDGTPSDTDFLVCAGEGRHFRVYRLSLGTTGDGHVAVSTFAKSQEFDIGAGSWVTAIAPLRAPSSSSESSNGRAYVGVGVSGLEHCVRLYYFTPTAASPSFNLKHTYHVRSDEVRGLTQLSDGRIVVAGCSSALDGDLNECGSIEIWSFESTEPARARTFLQNDIRVPSSIGLRCNAVEAWRDEAGRDHLVAAYEYCANGARQLVHYIFGSTSASESATNVESKHQPPSDENTFTDLVVSPDRRLVLAMTYGGRLAVFDLDACKRVHTLAAHAEAENEDGTHVMVAHAPDGTGVILTMGGDKEIKAWKRK